MSVSVTSLAASGYGIAAVIYAVLVAFLLTVFRRRLRGGPLAVAVLSTAVWAAFMAYLALGHRSLPLATFVVEVTLDAVWLYYLSALLGGARGFARFPILRYGGIVLASGVLFVGLVQEVRMTMTADASGAGSTLVLGSLLTSLFALVLIEQIYRNARSSQRRGLKFLCLGVGSLFIYDMLLYSDAVLEGGINPLLWDLRGFVVAMSAPILVLALIRSPAEDVGIFVSRHVAFYTATLFAAGLYLAAVGATGYYIRTFGGDVGQAAQLLFFAAATILFLVFAISDTTRARLRVLIDKHFYENKYDYREEWLKLTDSLTDVSDALPPKKRAIKALAQVLDAPSGKLWMISDQEDQYRCVAGWNVECGGPGIDRSEPLIQFLAETHWIIDIQQYLRDSSLYGDHDFTLDDKKMATSGYIIPLFDGLTLLGFVDIARGRLKDSLNYEDLDLLKTAGLQIANYLAQEAATEQLAEGRQFEAFNRLTAYLMHDLKNVIAQQALVVENAQKHKANPLFIDDAVETIKGSVVRMRRIIDHLQQRSQDQRLERVELCKLAMQAVSQCADHKPEPRVHIGDEAIWVKADRDSLMMAVIHAVRNAQDASDSSLGEVTVRVSQIDDTAHIEIIDNGSGMSEAFIRDHLFRPFDSTKGSQGMGIGAYQIRETVRALGGEVRVTSAPEEGTCILMTIRLAN